MGLLQSLVERAKNLGKKKAPAVEVKPRASIVLPTVQKAPPAKKNGDYIERGVNEAAVLTARVKAVAQNDLNMLQSTADLKLEDAWSITLDEQA